MMGGLPGTVVAVPSGQLILVVPFELTIRVVLPSALVSFEEPSGLVKTTVPSAFVSLIMLGAAFGALPPVFSFVFTVVPSRAILPRMPLLLSAYDYFTAVFAELSAPEPPSLFFTTTPFAVVSHYFFLGGGG